MTSISSVNPSRFVNSLTLCSDSVSVIAVIKSKGFSLLKIFNICLKIKRKIGFVYTFALVLFEHIF